MPEAHILVLVARHDDNDQDDIAEDIMATLDATRLDSLTLMVPPTQERILVGRADVGYNAEDCNTCGGGLVDSEPARPFNIIPNVFLFWDDAEDRTICGNCEGENVWSYLARLFQG